MEWCDSSLNLANDLDVCCKTSIEKCYIFPTNNLDSQKQHFSFYPGTMNEKTKKSVQIANNSSLVSDITYKKLLENCFSVLAGNNEIHNTASLCSSKSDVIKEVYAAILSSTVNFVRSNQNKDDVVKFLSLELGFIKTRANIWGEFYEKHKFEIEASLVNIGTYLPHITDVNWKIDYIIKSNVVDETTGPIFRISLITEKADMDGQKKIDYVNFICNTQELQDLVYKLKDAVRHCERITAEH